MTRSKRSKVGFGGFGGSIYQGREKSKKMNQTNNERQNEEESASETVDSNPTPTSPEFKIRSFRKSDLASKTPAKSHIDKDSTGSSENRVFSDAPTNRASKTSKTPALNIHARLAMTKPWFKGLTEDEQEKVKTLFRFFPPASQVKQLKGPRDRHGRYIGPKKTNWLETLKAKEAGSTDPAKTKKEGK